HLAVLLGLRRALEPRLGFTELLLVEQRDAHQHLRVRRVLELSLVEPAFERRRRASPILALDVHFAEPQVHLTRRRELSALLQRRNSFVELASGNPTIR